MAILAYFDQQPIEYRLRKIDYGKWLSTSEIIVSLTVLLETIRLSDTQNTGNDFVVDIAFIEPNEKESVLFYAGHGYDRDEYKVTVTITTNMNQTRQDEIFYRIIEV